MNIELVKLTSEYQTQLSDMLTEWKADIEKNNTNHSPWAIFRNDFHDFDSYLENLEIKKKETKTDLCRIQRCFVLTKTGIFLLGRSTSVTI